MKELQRIFEYNQRPVRVVIIDGQPWWVAKDVCDVIGLSNPSEAMNRLEEDEKSTLRISEGGPEVNIVNEPGLYSLILRSNKPEAKAFKRWITHEVLPAIRQTGHYSVKPMSQLEILAQATQALLEQERKLQAMASVQAAISQEVATIKHRIDNLDACNIEGNLQQRLNAMVRKYAHQTGVLFNVAWRDFVNAYNTAFCTNLRLLIENYKERHNLKDLTIPQYLSLTGRLEDALRVADKILNIERCKA